MEGVNVFGHQGHACMDPRRLRACMFCECMHVHTHDRFIRSDRQPINTKARPPRPRCMHRQSRARTETGTRFVLEPDSAHRRGCVSFLLWLTRIDLHAKQ
eukprot:6198440-Pleurochrysis_carterae.AAC.1